MKIVRGRRIFFWGWLVGWGCALVWGGNGYAQSINAQHGDRRLAPPRDSMLWQVGELLERLEISRAEEGEEGADVERDYSLAYEHFERLLEYPLAINRASRRELEQLFILSDFQITSLLTYRQKHGDILSGTELALLNGFNKHISDVLKPFITFEMGTAGAKTSGNFWRDCRSYLMVKSGAQLEQGHRGWGFPPDEFPRETTTAHLPEISPVYTYLKYQCDYLDRIQWGITLENDAGERFLGRWRVPLSDFFSFHAHIKSLRVGKMKAEVILGDFSARFGQGLTLWKSFQLNGASSPGGLYKKGASVLPYTSTDESNFLRGGAFLLSRDFEAGQFAGIRALEVTGFVSYRGVDARVEGDKYTSIQTGGLHRPGSGEEGRRAMHETMGGVHAVFIFSRWKVGLNWGTYGYDKVNGRRVTEYNRYQLYDAFWGNVSADFYAVVGRFRFFGELAVDYGGGGAGLLGMLFRTGEVELGVLVRSYGRGYIAPHAGAYSTASGCSNQQGVTVSGIWEGNRVFVLSGNLECTRYPAPRYRVPNPSWVVNGMIKGEYRQGAWDGYVRLSERFSTDKHFNKLGVKGTVGYQLWKPIRVGIKFEWVTVAAEQAGTGKEFVGGDNHNLARGEVVRRGTDSGMCSVELSYADPNGKISFRGGWSWFSAPEWDGRLYGYEAGLPGSYGSVLLYGKGGRGYLTAKVRLFPHCDLYGKGSFSRHKKGGGERELPAPRLRLQLGLKIKF